MEKGIEITIVIGTLNRPSVLMDLIYQLTEESKKIVPEVIVVDQSTRENYKTLKEKIPNKENFKLIHFDKPNTVKYLNYGWTHSRSQIVLFLDDDVTLTEKTIKAHIEAYKDPAIKGVAGRVVNDGEKTTDDSRVGKIFWFGALFTKNFTFQKQAFVDFPYGCNMSFRKQALKEVGGFDEKLSPPIYAYNEIDLGYRINKKWKNSILFSPEALVYHHQYARGGTRNDFEIKKVTDGNNYNYGYFLGKNFSVFENIICFARRSLYQIVREPFAIPAIMKGFLKGKKFS